MYVNKNNKTLLLKCDEFLREKIYIEKKLGVEKIARKKKAFINLGC